MQKNTVAVLDVGSSKLSLYVAERGLNKTFLIKSSLWASYAGYCDAVFFKPEEVPKCVHELLQNAEAELRADIGKVYVGVPSDFVTSYCKFFKISLGKNRKVTEEDIDKLYNAAYNVKNPEYKLISRSAVNFVLSGNRKVSSPKGAVSDTLGGMLSFYLAKESFLQIFNGEFKNLGVEAEYIPTALAETLYLFDGFERDKGGVLIDVGYIAGSFTLFSGDGVLYSAGFPMGGGHITKLLFGAFREKLGEKFTFAAAEKLKRMINISYRAYEGAQYEFTDKGNVFSVPVSEANDVVRHGLDELAEQISRCMEDGAIGYKGGLSIWLTGGGIAYIRGAKEHLSRGLGAIINTVAPKVPMYDKPVNSSAFSLLDLALKKQ